MPALFSGLAHLLSSVPLGSLPTLPNKQSRFASIYSSNAPPVPQGEHFVG